MVYGLLIPVALILLFNVIIFIFVVRQLSVSSMILGKHRNNSLAAKRQETIQRARRAISIVVLLGLTWTTGYLTLLDSSGLITHALFIICNSLQGMFIFILYCVRNPLVREQWSGMLGSCRGGRARSSQTSCARFSGGTGVASSADAPSMTGDRRDITMHDNTITI